MDISDIYYYIVVFLIILKILISILFRSLIKRKNKMINNQNDKLNIF